MDDYYLKTWYIRVASRVAERLKTLRNISKVPKLHRRDENFPYEHAQAGHPGKVV